MRQCPMMAMMLAYDPDTGRKVPVETRCQRRSWSRGRHLHDAPVPPQFASAHPGVRVRWRSSTCPDKYVAGWFDGGAA